MNVDQEHCPDPVAPQSELTPTEAPRPFIPPEIEQVIERMSARYIADLRTLEVELSQRVQATEGETLDVLPSELEHQQDISPAQIENDSSGFPSSETPILRSAEAPSLQPMQAQQSQSAQFREHFARPQAQDQSVNGLERLRQKGRDIRFSYWLSVLFLSWVVGALIGIGIVLFLME